MSVPKQVHIQGDLNISPGLESGLGDGSLYITGTSSVFDIQGETFLDKTNIDTTDGIFLVNGSNKISMGPTAAVEIDGAALSWFKTSVGDLQLNSTNGVLDMDGSSVTLNSNITTVGVTGATGVSLTSTLNNVTVNTGTDFDVNASSAITMDSSANSYFTVSGGGTLTMSSSSSRAILSGGGAVTNAITINTTNAAGGIDIDAGTAGIDILATNGGFSIDGQNVASNISLATNSNAQDFTISLTGNTDSSINIESSGTGVDAIKIENTTASGGIDINNGSNGFTLDSTGPISIDSQGTSNFTATGAYDLTLNTTGGKIVVEGGKNSLDAVKINTTNASAGIDVDCGTGGITVDTTGGFSIDSLKESNITLTGTEDFTVNNTGGRLLLKSTKASNDAVRIYADNASGGIDVDSGTGGITIDSLNTVSIDAQAAASNFSLLTNANAQDLTISVTGVTDSSLVLSSTGTSTTDAIIMNASAGGIQVDATKRISINTTDTSNGVLIATTTTGVPVTIGTSSSLTTIAGNLTVSGTTTTVNTETLTVSDNMVYLNSGNGELGLDGGMVVRRYQTANNTGTGGDVILDTAEGLVTGSFQAGSSTPASLVLSASASSSTDFYAGWWIKITSGAGINQVRRIKTYNGITKTATIYVTADGTDGLDLVTAPAVSNTYSLFNSPFVSSFYDESADKWVMAFTNTIPDPISSPGVSSVNIQRYAAIDTGALTIQSNGNNSSSVLNVNYINEFTSDIGVTIEGVNINNGLIGGSAPDVTEIVLLPDNATTKVIVVNTDIRGSYMVFVDAVQASSGVGSFLRQAGGAFSIFAIASSGTGGSINRLASTKGSSNERVDGDWLTGEKFKIYHQPAKTGGTGASVPYRVKVQRVV